MYRVGIIPFRQRAPISQHGQGIDLLCVTSMSRGRWIFPKGRLKEGETHVEACHREGFEEAGVRGRVIAQFPMTVAVEKSVEGLLPNDRSVATPGRPSGHQGGKEHGRERAAGHDVRADASAGGAGGGAVAAQAALLKVPVTFYPFAVSTVAEAWDEQDRRARRWVAIEEVATLFSEADHRDLFAQFQTLLPWIIETAIIEAADQLAP